jgi:hypothetical protein
MISSGDPTAVATAAFGMVAPPQNGDVAAI